MRPTYSRYFPFLLYIGFFCRRKVEHYIITEEEKFTMDFASGNIFLAMALECRAQSLFLALGALVRPGINF